MRSWRRAGPIMRRTSPSRCGSTGKPRRAPRPPRSAPRRPPPPRRCSSEWPMPRKNNPAKPSPARAPTLPSPASGGGLGRGREKGYPETRCGYVALIGAPNAGKSTLLNQLVGRKLAIVTPKVQTTRSRLLGIVIVGPAQLVLVDTPGIFAPRRRLDRAMVAAAWAGMADADQTVLLVDATR